MMAAVVVVLKQEGTVTKGRAVTLSRRVPSELEPNFCLCTTTMASVNLDDPSEVAIVLAR